MTEARVRLAGLKLPSLLCSGINMCSLPQDKVTQHWLTRGGGGGACAPRAQRWSRALFDPAAWLLAASRPCLFEITSESAAP